MAARSKRKKSAGQKRRNTKKKAQEKSFLGDEILIWGTLAVSILLLISNFGFGGAVCLGSPDGYIRMGGICRAFRTVRGGCVHCLQ